MCVLPIALPDADGAPVRAVAMLVEGWGSTTCSRDGEVGSVGGVTGDSRRAALVGGGVGVVMTVYWVVTSSLLSRCEGLACLPYAGLYFGLPLVSILVGGLAGTASGLRRPWLFALAGIAAACGVWTLTTLLLVALPQLATPTVSVHHLIVGSSGILGYVGAAVLVSGRLPRRAVGTGGAVMALLIVAAVVSWSVVPVAPGPNGLQQQIGRLLTRTGLPPVKIDASDLALVGVGTGSAGAPYVLRYDGVGGTSMAGTTMTVEVRSWTGVVSCARSPIPASLGASCEEHSSGRLIYRSPDIGTIVVIPRDVGVAVVRSDRRLPTEQAFLHAYQVRTADLQELTKDIVAL